MSDDDKMPNGEDSEARLKRLREGFAKASDRLDRSARGKVPPPRHQRPTASATPPQAARPLSQPRMASPTPSSKGRIGWWGVVLAITAVLIVIFAVRDLIT
jgi:hypothetical protein